MGEAGALANIVLQFDAPPMGVDSGFRSKNRPIYLTCLEAMSLRSQMLYPVGLRAPEKSS